MTGGIIFTILMVYAIGGIPGGAHNAMAVNGESSLRPFIFGFFCWPLLVVWFFVKEWQKGGDWYKKETVKTEEEMTIEHLKKRRDELFDEYLELGVELRKLEPEDKKTPKAEVSKPYSPPTPTPCCNATAAAAPQTVIIREDKGIDLVDVAIGAVIGGILL